MYNKCVGGGGGGGGRERVSGLMRAALKLLYLMDYTCEATSINTWT